MACLHDLREGVQVEGLGPVRPQLAQDLAEVQLAHHARDLLEARGERHEAAIIRRAMLLDGLQQRREVHLGGPALADGGGDLGEVHIRAPLHEVLDDLQRGRGVQVSPQHLQRGEDGLNLVEVAAVWNLPDGLHDRLQVNFGPALADGVRELRKVNVPAALHRGEEPSFAAPDGRLQLLEVAASEGHSEGHPLPAAAPERRASAAEAAAAALFEERREVDLVLDLVDLLDDRREAIVDGLDRRHLCLLDLVDDLGEVCLVPLLRLRKGAGEVPAQDPHGVHELLAEVLDDVLRGLVEQVRQVVGLVLGGASRTRCRRAQHVRR
mmetsp:Transcript_126729/g.405779  ORF Transcript_126729/g.405779 Transcript_126729/m.405779 type:complete len:323 (+) Transcript_126729:735-1703(+)